jgi:hypothetical protein
VGGTLCRQNLETISASTEEDHDHGDLEQVMFKVHHNTFGPLRELFLRDNVERNGAWPHLAGKVPV